MRKFGLIGYPLGHSFSQKYFSEKFQKEGLADCSYENFPLTSIDQLPLLLKKEPSLGGLNVTIPYKQKVIELLDAGSRVVDQTGACNCILIQEGKLFGFNTDVIGFEQTLVKNLRPSDSKALILGTGGSSKAVAYVLKKLGIDYIFVSRNPGPESVNTIAYSELDEATMESNSLIINASPSGMFPNETNFPAIPYHLLNHHHYLYDLVYNPAQTLFLQKGRARGTRTQNGEEMLIIQAEESWKIWMS
jgi:shikimate dehydrogenase